MNNREEHRQRISLVLLISVSVLVLISVAVVLAVLTVYVLIRFNVIVPDDENLSLGTLFSLIVYVSAVIGLIIAFFSSRYSLKPVNQLINQLERLSKGDFSTRIKFGNPIAVHPAFRNIENSFNKTAEELERTEMLRGDFINNFSHEFKTPIVSIAGFAKMLRVADLSEEERAEYLEIIEEESLRLSYMATNVLNLTRVENQTILTNVSKYNLSEQIRQDILMLTDMWTQKNLILDIDFAEYTIEANKELLEQAWINLLNNAVKFSDDGGTVSVTISESEDNISVAISNGGKTIPAEKLDRIFNKFYQADESHSAEGNGIGLAIVKKVVELHNGGINVKSENGKTTFTVILPK
ncbi:MAG: HAMP domain-containing histidine kinase [Firmicutes bacterium]|nr:HAMP domain-containing histidine kinase [Bacillota bacterium]